MFLLSGWFKSMNSLCQLKGDDRFHFNFIVKIVFKKLNKGGQENIIQLKGSNC